MRNIQYNSACGGMSLRVSVNTQTFPFLEEGGVHLRAVSSEKEFYYLLNKYLTTKKLDDY